ncbi:GPR1/FUN34/yaaH family [Aspergillus sclerotialis]|uniref:GPR1/FUN34/yaaH family n=1 Tax=Aspergillus sclerotialis TaxID=2070753 RepID=A0A3A3A5B0_9EURO|nr:GPR1/FUN34/yaaH family [Aspergillus sclerotialis]
MSSNGATPMNEKENQTRYSDNLPPAGGHEDVQPRPVLPVATKRVATPAGLGLISFATDIFLISIYGLQARGIQNPNIMVGMLVAFGGLCQFLAGIMEFVNRNTFGATVFCSYAALNWSYALIYIPGSGIMSAYTDANGALSPEFNQAVSIYMWVWFIISVLFTVAAYKSTWIVFIDMISVDLCLLLLACGFMVSNQSVLTAGYSFGMVACFLSYWAGCSAMWADTTPIKLPMFQISRV